MASKTTVLYFGIQKGGAAKSTTAATTAYILARRGQRVLAVDLDSQGNLTNLLSDVDDIYEYSGRTALEAMKAIDADGEELVSRYVHPVSNGIDLMPSEDFMATLSRWLYREFERSYPGKNPGLVLRAALNKILQVRPYDYVVIDSPPSLGDQSINGMAAATHIVSLFEPSKFCLDALPRFFETVHHVRQQLNPNLKVAGILATMVDKRRSDARLLVETLQDDEEYGPLLFEQRIYRRAATGRLNLQGFATNPELRRAIKEYEQFTEELLQRL
ncbi:ParA family protein [Alicyclobacillus fastidiosus]|uniref:ParA family protein n=1 Tax=Alicyclobacillus fastidiosus TaxID=392011 RepID=A0ABY6ZFS9_9BACL|nr:ParA family protein [Alicyclobacillus fastidiosus]WAH41697.1 ParA family protein [Alicyclobacillus fastidiosus]GMA63376.1 chromosome partitioning protein ParA [Alicyclobacillus fastidiosus]